ncbi:hypothetical protein KY290_034702 [Solanum tuberosum]|uniref:Uncharacterized protein n=1 Tax=Solanum tuberosum TaxID=4113 RepID=A0ABQ7U525_SOLTU|nr:hypothetical protein KY289_034071 [Solanum tuberosum]KAH0648690.1 hypothetical protein KY285_033938 [Solanum tuberosum]KAH0741659.1 hypothetical protein KY290_034702 [Solanum tuberosum]
MTLTSVSIALPNINFHSIKELIGCVNEGLMYIKVAEDNLDARKDLANIRRAGSRISVKTATEGQNSKDMLEGLSEKAKQRFIEFRKKDLTVCPKESQNGLPICWQPTALVLQTYKELCNATMAPLRRDQKVSVLPSYFSEKQRIFWKFFVHSHFQVQHQINWRKLIIGVQLAKETTSPAVVV